LEENCIDLHKFLKENEKVYITSYLQTGNYRILEREKLLLPDDPDFREILKYEKIATTYYIDETETIKTIELTEDNFNLIYDSDTKSLSFVDNEDNDCFYVSSIGENGVASLNTTKQELNEQFCRMVCNASIQPGEFELLMLS
jgi:translation elongation factor P/translation initiation factor 5A